MFGKKSRLSETQKFVIAKGREVGNLKQPGPAFNKKKAMAPAAKTPVRGNSDKKSVATLGNRKPSVGKFGTFKTEGMVK